MVVIYFGARRHIVHGSSHVRTELPHMDPRSPFQSTTNSLMPISSSQVADLNRHKIRQICSTRLSMKHTSCRTSRGRCSNRWPCRGQRLYRRCCRCQHSCFYRGRGIRTRSRSFHRGQILEGRMGCGYSIYEEQRASTPRRPRRNSKPEARTSANGSTRAKCFCIV